jgi:sugar lactone lactonase YvrE
LARGLARQTAPRAMTSATRLLHVQARLGEGAIWDTKASVLWWVDIDGRELHRYDPATSHDQSWAMPSTIGTVVPRARGGVVVALKNIIAAFDPATASLTTLAGIDQADQRFNDGKCDPAGRLWVGTIDFTERPNVAALYRLDERGINSQVSGVTISNGIVWSRDGRTCWYIDTPTRRVDAFDFDVAGGRLSNRRPAVVFPDGVGFPDGMAIDEHERLWVAMWGGGCVLCCDPHGGRIVDRIAVPGAMSITSCAFGGPDLRTLYITSAGGDRADAETPDAGDLFVAHPGVRGMPSTPFAG